MYIRLSRSHLWLMSRLVCVLSLTRSSLGQQEPPLPEQASVPLPLSTQAAPGQDAGFKRLVPEKANWKGQEYDIGAGIRVLMSVVISPTTKSDERAIALRALGHLNRKLRGDPCIDDLVALYPKLETTDEQASLLNVLNNSEDRRVLPLSYNVAVEGAEPHLRLLAAAALARWNIRRGVEVLVEFFPSGRKETAQSHGVEALMLFDVLNRTKGWGWPMAETGAPVGAQSEPTYSAVVALAESGFRKWFEQNKHRFPDWKPGDPLPTSPPFEPDKPSNEKAP